VSGLLLDTCALIWSADTTGAPAGLRVLLASAWRDDRTLAVSPISAWEIGTLAASGRATFGMSPFAWFQASTSRARLQETDLTAQILIASTDLPHLDHRDPADRIIIATAREFGYRIVTRDRKILDYADKGHVMALAC
jgi:PIN domain nuclease of toxin-antitoxin system